jgi:dihydroorotate dehydrogenase (NAD+) catalytic subunit
MRIDLKTRKPLLANRTGGLSGGAIFPVALRMVYDVYDSVKIPIIGVGGISTPNTVIEMMLAGAAAVEIGAANLIDPYACKMIIEGLPASMKKYGIHNLQDIIGGAHG